MIRHVRFSLADAFRILAVVFILSAGTSSARSGDLWTTGGKSSSRMIRDENAVANSSRKNTTHLTPLKKDPEFGDLDPSQDYFSYEEYVDVVKETPTAIPTTPEPTTPTPQPPLTKTPKAVDSNNAGNVNVNPRCSKNSVGFKVHSINILTLLTSVTILVTRYVYYSV